MKIYSTLFYSKFNKNHLFTNNFLICLFYSIFENLKELKKLWKKIQKV